MNEEKRAELVESVLEKITSDIGYAYAAPEAWERTKAKIRARLDGMTRHVERAAAGALPRQDPRSQKPKKMSKEDIEELRRVLEDPTIEDLYGIAYACGWLLDAMDRQIDAERERVKDLDEAACEAGFSGWVHTDVSDPRGSLRDVFLGGIMVSRRLHEMDALRLESAIVRVLGELHASRDSANEDERTEDARIVRQLLSDFVPTTRLRVGLPGRPGVTTLGDALERADRLIADRRWGGWKWKDLLDGDAGPCLTLRRAVGNVVDDPTGFNDPAVPKFVAYGNPCRVVIRVETSVDDALEAARIVFAQQDENFPDVTETSFRRLLSRWGAICLVWVEDPDVDRRGGA